MIDMTFTSTGRIYKQNGNTYELVISESGAYRLVTNNDKVYFGLDVEKFDIKNHLVKK